jgi:hypothetical protein
VVQVVEYLRSKHGEALSSNASTEKKKIAPVKCCQMFKVMYSFDVSTVKFYFLLKKILS